MTTKQELTDKIAELQAQVDAMPDDKPKNPVFIATEGRAEDYYYMHTFGGVHNIVGEGTTEDMSGPTFRTKQAAEAYSEAFKVVLECHAMSDWVEGDCFTVVDYEGRVEAEGICAVRVMGVFGRFASRKSAQACTDKVGKARLEKAVDVLMRGKV